MTAPRRIIPGTIYLLTRRCSERRYFLRPSSTTNALVSYVLAVAARRYGILVHAFCVLSNHCHLVATDPRGCLPAFMQYFDSLVARAMNASLGRSEAFWSTDNSYSAVEPLDPADVIAKIAYVLANPVAAALVRHGDQWPGLRTAPGQVGRARIPVRRPARFFSEDGYMPETSDLELSVPAGFASAAELQAAVRSATNELEERHRQRLASEGRRFAGVFRVLSQDPRGSPPTPAPRFGLKPRIAARDRWKRIEGIFRLKTFLSAYRDAWNRRRAGEPNVVFPAGTYLLRIMHGVPVAGFA